MVLAGRTGLLGGMLNSLYQIRRSLGNGLEAQFCVEPGVQRALGQRFSNRSLRSRLNIEIFA
jgi:hypothetical protein